MIADPSEQLHTLHDVVAAWPRLGRRRALASHTEFGLRWWTYGRLHQETHRAAAWLQDHGVGPGDRLVLWASNSPEWAALFFGAALRGVILVLVDADVPAATVEELAERHQCRLIFHDARRTRPAATRATWVPINAPQKWIDEAGADAIPVAVTADSPVVLLFSSGTTAQPAMISLTHRNLLVQVAPFRAWRLVLRVLPIRMLVLPPLSHVLGLVIGLLVPLSIGLGVVFATDNHPSTWARIIRTYRISILLAVPRALQVLQRLIERAPAGRSGASLEQRLRQAGPLRRVLGTVWARGEVLGRPLMRLIFVGGARLPDETARFWRRSGIIVVQGYGLAETTGFVTIASPFSGDVGHVGRPLGDRRVMLAPDGEILVRGPNLARVADSSNEVAPPIDGWLPTGDLGRLDRRGRLWIIGRKKDVIVTAEGFNVHPDEVDAAIGRQPGVIESAAVALVREQGEVVHAVLRLEPGIDAATVVRGANAALGAHEKIQSWSEWPNGEDMPRGAMGKIRRAEVAARLAGHGGTANGLQPRARPAMVRLSDVMEEPDRDRRVALLARFIAQDGMQESEGGLRLVDDLGLKSLDIVDCLAGVEAMAPGPMRPLVVREQATLADLSAWASPSREAGPSGEAGPPPGPSWTTFAVSWLRPIALPAILSVWSVLNVVVRARWHVDDRTLDRPFIIAAAPHRHWLDAFAIALALPARFRRRLHLVIENRFEEHVPDDSGSPAMRRALQAFVYHFALPALFPFTIVQPFGRTRDALFDVAARIDRGRIPLSFPKGLAYYGLPQRHAHGAARLAIATGCAIVPVYLESHHVKFGWQWRRPRQRITVHFGPPIATTPDADAAQIAEEVEASFDRLAGRNRYFKQNSD